MTTHARGHTRTSAAQGPAADPVPAVELADWVSAGIITQEQADRIAAHERSRGTRQPTPLAAPPSLLAEALGYVGGVIILVAAVLLATEFWDELGTAGRLIVVGAAAATMLVAGIAVPQRAGEQGQRLRAVLWAGATGAFAGFVGMLTSDVFDMSENDVALTTTALTAAAALTLWWRRPTLLQHLVVVVALAATASATVARISEADYLPGAGAWAVGVGWFLLASDGRLRPRRFALAIGATIAVIGAQMTLPTDGGIVLALATAAAVVTVAVVMTDLVLLAVGAVGLLLALPVTVQTWFGGAFAAPIALLGAGLVLVGAALWIARRKHRPGHADATPGVAPHGAST
jgi:hypothetical protein